MGRFSDFDTCVADFMADYGFEATYLKTLSSVPNDLDGTVTVNSQSIAIYAIRAELFRPLNGTGTKPQTTIQEGDLVLYVQPTEKADEFADALIVDASNDKIIIAGQTW